MRSVIPFPVRPVRVVVLTLDKPSERKLLAAYRAGHDLLSPRGRGPVEPVSTLDIQHDFGSGHRVAPRTKIGVACTAAAGPRGLREKNAVGAQNDEAAPRARPGSLAINKPKDVRRPS